jgi:hypothetical protein
MVGCNSGGTFSNTESKVSNSSTEASPPPNEEPEEEGSIQTSATTSVSEPISVGGAFLSCQYSANQDQSNPQWQVSCSLNDTDELNQIKEVKAEFYKVDPEGNRYSLQIEDFVREEFRWSLTENRLSTYLPTIRAEISFDGSDKILFESESTDQPRQLQVQTDYWLGGEPNNLLGNDPDGENCAEFGNAAYRLDHMDRTGLQSTEFGRLNDGSCALVRRYLCRRSIPATAVKWQISDVAGTFNEHPTGCPDGYHFAMPLTDADLQEVMTLTDQIDGIFSLWVAFTDQTTEGEFELIFPAQTAPPD